MLRTFLTGGLRSPRAPALSLVAALSIGFAPFQCASEPPPSQAREDSPADALVKLADEFDKAGDKAGRVRTLRFLVERYPRSRLAEEAKLTLRDLGEVVDEPAASASAAPSASAAANANASASAAPSAPTATAKPAAPR